MLPFHAECHGNERTAAAISDNVANVVEISVHGDQSPLPEFTLTNGYSEERER